MRDNKVIDTQTKLLLSALLIVIGLIVYGILNPKSDDELTKETVDAFNKNEELICKESPIVNSKALLLSKPRGWEIYGEYFKKDEMLIPVANCKKDL